ncbi:MAG: peptidyl-prolyl cis-trans isomerase [Polyangiaceae bacterium]
MSLRDLRLPEVSLALGCAFLGLVIGCTRSRSDAPQVIASASPEARGLSREEAAQVLAKVGDVTITLGDYAAALDRMDRYERLRYQSADRRQALLDEMINVELLAQEAKRQKLDETDEFKMRLDQALRDEVLADLRASVPTPDAIPSAEVRAHYDAHRAEYREPERRRGSAIVVTDEKKAQSLIDQAKKADAVGFGELVRKHSVLRDKSESAPLELEGDLGIVSAVGEPNGAGPVLPEAIRKALFEIPKVGDLYIEPVRAEGRYYILRMTGRTEARERSFAEAERSIRVRIVDERIASAERELIEKLKGRTTITLDDAALAKLRVPPAKEETRRDALGR